MCASDVCVKWRVAYESVDVFRKAGRLRGLARAEPSGPGLCCPEHDACSVNMIYTDVTMGVGLPEVGEAFRVVKEETVYAESLERIQ